ncbi:hypothetical protein T07_10078 [Trichinella nelsoni]|uniref:Uncharacterized protein n=1 Tax=Trichinella nelsoni TaxID=6336 RepID=A0A0V0RQV7_9BILA|nr:hypothetical protein T07_10078 [Trichinella nelsoni]
MVVIWTSIKHDHHFDTAPVAQLLRPICSQLSEVVSYWASSSYDTFVEFSLLLLLLLFSLGTLKNAQPIWLSVDNVGHFIVPYRQAKAVTRLTGRSARPKGDPVVVICSPLTAGSG